MKQKLIQLQGEIDKSVIIVRNVNTPLLVMKGARRQKISKDVEVRALLIKLT